MEDGLFNTSYFPSGFLSILIGVFICLFESLHVIDEFDTVIIDEEDTFVVDTAAVSIVVVFVGIFICLFESLLHVVAVDESDTLTINEEDTFVTAVVSIVVVFVAIDVNDVVDVIVRIVVLLTSFFSGVVACLRSMSDFTCLSFIILFKSFTEDVVLLLSLADLILIAWLTRWFGSNSDISALLFVLLSSVTSFGGKHAPSPGVDGLWCNGASSLCSSCATR